MEHMKGAHRNRTYDCAICGKKFRWRAARNRHVSNIHSRKMVGMTDDTTTETSILSRRAADTTKEMCTPPPADGLASSGGMVKKDDGIN